eukprot:gene25432-31059_t
MARDRVHTVMGNGTLEQPFTIKPVRAVPGPPVMSQCSSVDAAQLAAAIATRDHYDARESHSGTGAVAAAPTSHSSVTRQQPPGSDRASWETAVVPGRTAGIEGSLIPENTLTGANESGTSGIGAGERRSGGSSLHTKIVSPIQASREGGGPASGEHQ